MATVLQYVTQLRAAQRTIGVRMGSDTGQRQKSDRVLIASLLAILAVLIKVLVDKGVVTDQELVAALNQARAALYADEQDGPLDPEFPTG